MKNKIFKNYAKKIIKSEAFVSVIIVFVLALGIIGSSYALYMDIDTDTDYQLLKVGDLSIGFNNGSNLVTLENMTPTSDDIAIGKVASEDNISQNNLTSFYIYNTGTYTANYKINLRAVEGNQVETKYINYQICRDNADNCKEIGTLNESGDTTIYVDELTPNSTAIDTSNTNPSAYYFVRLWINDKYDGTNEAKTIKVQFVIDATNASGYLDNDNTLSGRILNDSRITINNNQPDFNGVGNFKITDDSSSGEPGLYKAPDDYGVSYYFRGIQSYNYVNFAGFVWRIVRINGDGSIRLILEGSLDKVDGCDDANICKLTAFHTPTSDDNGHGGYMFGDFSTSSSSYDDAHENKKNSNIKDIVDAFYEEYIMDYENYLADTIFCGDKTLASSGIGGVEEQKGYANYKTYYGLYERLYINSDPTLECAKGETNTYSRYTSIIDLADSTSKGVKVNNDLIHPIALLSADEIIMAGAYKSVINTNYYLFDAYRNQQCYDTWWGIGDFFYSGWNSFVFNSASSYSSMSFSNITGEKGIRPVINLRKDVLIVSGNGTKTNTYDSEGNILTGPYNIIVK